MMSDDCTASPLIRKGQAVLGYASAIDHERGARQIPRIYARVTLMSLKVIEKVTGS